MAWVGGGTFPELAFDVFKVTPAGRAEPLGWEPREYFRFRVSPKGTRVAYDAGPISHFEIYVRDLARGVTLRLRTGGRVNDVGAWSPDGASLLIASDRERVARIYRASADNSAPPEAVASDTAGIVYGAPGSWSSQGVIAYVKVGTGGPDIWTVAPGAKPVPFVATDAAESSPAFSPDGRWLAYVSDASGRDEVYVRPYPGPGAAIPVSGNGGGAPAWSPDGRRIYYIQDRLTPAVKMMVANVVSRAPLRVGRARSFIDPWPYATAANSRNYDVMPDGSFIVSQLRGSDGSGGIRAVVRRKYRVGEIHVILNFAGGLARETSK